MYLRCGDKGIQTIAGQVRLWTTAQYLSGNFRTGVKDSQREAHTKPLLHYTNFYVLCACVCMCECRLTCTMEHMWRSEVNSQELVITFCLVLRQGLFCYFMLYRVKAGWSQVSRWFSHLCLPSHHRSARITDTHYGVYLNHFPSSLSLFEIGSLKAQADF